MYNSLGNILLNANKSNKRLNILTQPTHEGYQTLFGHLPHNFFMIQGQGIKTWDFHTRPLPNNHYIIQKEMASVPAGLKVDIILTQERFGALQRGLQVGTYLSCPVVHIDHTMPPPNVTKKQMREMQSLRANKHVYITEFSKNAWGGRPEDLVINHGIDTEIFKGWSYNQSARGVSIVNFFRERDVFCGWNLWESVLKERPLSLVGENPGLSKSVSNPKELAKTLSQHAYYLNTSQWSPVPLSLLEAMSMGMPVISTPKQEIPNIISHGQNGMLADTKEEIIACIDKITNDKEFAEEIGKNARQTVLERFSLEQFTDRWNKLFMEVYENGR